MRIDYPKGLVLAASLLFATGCVQARKDAKGKGNDALAQARIKEPNSADKSESADTKHAGWWCKEHGIPEHMCSLCSDEVAEKLKKEGDWCKIHERAQSQCFKCDPSKYAKFEAMYEAKYGKKPPRPLEEEFQK